jgi:hypothetical protein
MELQLWAFDNMGNQARLPVFGHMSAKLFLCKVYLIALYQVTASQAVHFSRSQIWESCASVLFF